MDIATNYKKKETRMKHNPDGLHKRTIQNRNKVVGRLKMKLKFGDFARRWDR